MAHVRGITLSLLALLVATGCGTGNRLDLPGDGPGGGQFLPVIHQVDSGVISLTDGVFAGGGNDLVLSDPFSGAAVVLVDNSTLASAEQIYDVDGDGDMDFVVITIRALSAQGAGCVTAEDANGAAIDPASFSKVGGAALEPLDLQSTANFSITLPVYPGYGSANLAVYKFDNYYLNQGGHTPADDVGTGSGAWVHYSDTIIDNGNDTVTFSATSLGEYALAVLHSLGSGGDI